MSKRPRRTQIGVVVPALNEALVIGDCIASIERSAGAARRLGIRVRVHVVCDACTDATEQRVVDAGLIPVTVSERNVGAARAVGAKLALDAGATWLAFTDADSVVSDTWLVDQLALDVDAFCGTVAVSDWGAYGQRMKDHFMATYTDAEGHRHVHGANLGMSAAAYEAVGGFQNLVSSEDVALVNALIAGGFQIAWSAKPRVTTSARIDHRAPDGFGATLARVASAFTSLSIANGVGQAVHS